MLPVFADATADRREILVMAGGGPEVAHEMLRAAKHMEGLTPLFKPSNPPGALVAPLTWAAVLQLQDTFTYFFNGWTLGPTLQAWLAEQMAARYAAAMGTGTIDYTPPAGLTPYPWQVSGAAMIAATGRSLITDEPRTGKTITTILGLVQWASQQHAGGAVVVVCPASVVDPWLEAWQSWAPHVRAVAWRGPKRRELLGTADVYVTSYETARTDAPVGGTKGMRPLLKGFEPSALVIDECHLAKNATAKRTQALERIAKRVTDRGGAVVALSGTPITHDPGDLHPVLKMMEPGAYPSKERWVTRYCNVLPGEYEDENLGLLAAREPEFRLSLLGQTRRVARADVMSHLPAKTYSVRTVELPKAWRKIYDDFETQMLAELPDGDELAAFDSMSVFSHLSSLASAPCDVDVTWGPDLDKHTGLPKRHMHLDLKGPSWKIDALLEVMSERVGERVVVYTPRAQLARLAGGALAKAGYRTGYIIGGQSQGERTRNRLAFQGGELDVVCATTGAGGVGITLSAAETLVFLQRPWALVESIQAEDRAEGDPNATRGTEIIDIVAKGTIESRVRSVLRARAGQLADLVQDPRIVRELLGGAAVERQAA